MKIKAERFNEIVMSCQEQSDLQLFLVEYGMPLWITEEVTDDEQAAIDMIINILQLISIYVKQKLVFAMRSSYWFY